MIRFGRKYGALLVILGLATLITGAEFGYGRLTFWLLMLAATCLMAVRHHMVRRQPDVDHLSREAPSSSDNTLEQYTHLTLVALTGLAFFDFAANLGYSRESLLLMLFVGFPVAYLIGRNRRASRNQ